MLYIVLSSESAVKPVIPKNHMNCWAQNRLSFTLFFILMVSKSPSLVSVVGGRVYKHGWWEQHKISALFYQSSFANDNTALLSFSCVIAGRAVERDMALMVGINGH